MNAGRTEQKAAGSEQTNERMTSKGWSVVGLLVRKRILEKWSLEVGLIDRLRFGVVAVECRRSRGRRCRRRRRRVHDFFRGGFVDPRMVGKWKTLNWWWTERQSADTSLHQSLQFID